MYDGLVASSHKDFFNILETVVGESERELLWFRGQRVSSWDIIPSLYRNANVTWNRQGTYSNTRLREEYRFHSFRAKTGHSIQTAPKSPLEWQEIMQHHGVKTRLIDWTESATTAMLFALEELFMATPNVKQQQGMTPAIWILKPKKLNSIIYELITRRENGRYPFIEKAIALISGKTKMRVDARRIAHELAKNKDLYFSLSTNYSIDGLVNLSAIEELRNNYSVNTREALLSFELNPFHYVLLRLYADGIASTIKPGESILPPVATIQQYHSERIEAQRGVFLVSPYYQLSLTSTQLSAAGVDFRALNMQPGSHGFLHKVRLIDPVHIVRELLYSGERRSSIYPEIPVYADDIEANKLVY